MEKKLKPLSETLSLEISKKIDKSISFEEYLKNKLLCRCRNCEILHINETTTFYCTSCEISLKRDSKIKNLLKK